MNRGLVKAKVVAMALIGGLPLLGACAPRIDNAFSDDAAWQQYGSKGVIQLAAAPGSGIADARTLTKPQIAGDWTIHAQLTYSSAATGGDNQTGLILFADNQNYLVWGPVGNRILQWRGMIGGQPTTIAQTSTKYPHLRIMKRTDPVTAVVSYLAYGADDAYRAWQYIGTYADDAGAFATATYGLAAYDNTASGTGFVAQYDFCGDYVLENYKDTFGSATIDGAWQPVIADRGTVKETSGYVTLAADGAPAGMVRNPLFPDWVIQAQKTTQTGTSGVAGLLVYAGLGDYVVFGTDGTGGYVISGKVGGSPVDVPAVGSGGAKFLKATKSGGSYVFSYSSTGNAWQTAGTYTDQSGALASARYGLMVTGTTTGRFDWFAEAALPNGAIQSISSIEEVAQLTGEAGINQTESRFKWGSGDLGSMFTLGGVTYQVFGDTFERNTQGGAWYRNSIATITSPNFANGLVYDTMRTGLSGLVTPRPGSDDFSMIPVYGVGVNRAGVDTLYLYIMEIHRWGDGGHWDCNGGAWAVSTDGGTTWQLTPQLFGGNSNFIQLAIYQVGDDVYVLGAPGGGEGAVKLMKVPATDLLDRSAYRFYAGTDTVGKPQWSDKEQDAVAVIGSVNREIAVTWDEYLGRFLFTTLDNVSQQMVIRDAPNLWGPWSRPQLLFDEAYVAHQDPTNPAFYGSYMLPQYMENGGETVYMTLNKWIPYQIFWNKVTFVKQTPSDPTPSADYRGRADEFALGIPNDTWGTPGLFAGGTYTMVVKTGDTQTAGADKGVKLLKAPVGDNWTIETSLAGGLLASDGNWQAGLLVYRDAQDWLGLGLGPHGTIAAQVEHNGQTSQIASTASSATHLRIVKSGNVYSFYASPDGATWASAGATYDDSSGALRGGLYGVLGANADDAQGVNLPAWPVTFGYFKESAQ